MSGTFDEFVRKQVASKGEEDMISLDDEKATWLEKLDELYRLVEDSLRQYIDDRSVTFTLADVTLTEEQLGSYPAKAGRIVIGNQVVELKPLGTFLIGARGRVDMVGPRGIARFVIVPPDAKGFTVRVSVVKPGERPTSPEKPTVPPSAWRWKLVTSPPRISYIELTQESFRDALVGVVDG